MPNNRSIKIAVTSAQLAAEYQAGATIRQLAAKYGCSFQNINIRVQNAGVGMRPSGQRHPPMMKQCPTCKKTFRAYARAQIYCSSLCIHKKEYCVHGHALTEENRYQYPGGHSRCRQCHRARNKANYERKKGTP